MEASGRVAAGGTERERQRPAPAFFMRALKALLRGALYLLYLAIVLELATRLLLWPYRSLQYLVGGSSSKTAQDNGSHRYFPDSSINRLTWIKRHGASKTLYYSFDRSDPLFGWSLKPNIVNKSVFENKVLNSNSQGIRGKAEYRQGRLADKKRIVVLGDSQTFGEDVSDDETYVHNLESLLPGTEVINLGVHGYGHDQMLLYFKKEGVKYAPDLVLLGFVWDDIPRNTLGFRDYWKPRFVLRNHELVLTHVPVPSPDEVLRQEIYQPKLLDVSLILWHRLRFQMGKDQQEGYDLAAAIFDDLATSCQKIGAKLAFAYLPIWDEVTNRTPGMLPDEQFLSQYCDSRHLPCVFLRQTFLKAQDAGYKPSTGVGTHWRPDEHRIAARAIGDFIVQKGLIQ
jgi:hypothetical protein